jgi:SAM-dependent methyltransferase
MKVLLTNKVINNKGKIIMNDMKENEIKQAVRENYGKVATSSGASGCCCGPSCCSPTNSGNAADTSVNIGYSKEDVESVPDGANMGLGCGNPQAIASLKPGETVLDLGCGGGFDCFLAVKQVGEKGLVIGVDMTPEMVSKARKNVSETKYANIDIRLGEIENLPVADSVVDVIISNCVINLSPNKQRVFTEAFRVLTTGGRIAVSDVIASAPIPDNVRNDLALHAGCIAGASTREEVIVMLQKAGFCDIRVTPKEASRSFIKDWAPESGAENYVVSADIQAAKK